jgi:hypothetical protein
VAETGGGYLDAFLPSLDRGSSDFDVRHSIAGHFIWEIPLGRSSQNRKAQFLIGGWEISGLLNYQSGQPFSIGDSGVPDFTTERTRPRLTGVPPGSSPLLPDSVSPNSFLYVPINQVYDPVSGVCLANTAPFACQISVNGPFDGTVGRNTFRQPGTYFQDTALIKTTPLSRDGMKLQFRAEFYNVLNHPNLYVNSGSTDVNAETFTSSTGQHSPGVTASFRDNRQIVLALKLLF